MDNVIGLNGFRSRNFSQEYLRLNIYGPRKVLVYVSQIMHEYMCVCVWGERSAQLSKSHCFLIPDGFCFCFVVSRFELGASCLQAQCLVLSPIRPLYRSEPEQRHPLLHLLYLFFAGLMKEGGRGD